MVYDQGTGDYLGLVADALGDTMEAVSQYQAPLKNNPNDSAVYNKLGVLSLSAGKSGEAISHLQRSVQLNPANTSARLNLAIAMIGIRVPVLEESQ